MIGEVNVKLSTDLMFATACIVEGSEEVTPELVHERLEALGIKTGVIEENVEALARMTSYNQWLMVAKGKKPGETKPGYFEFFFDNSKTDAKTRIDEQGKVHYGKSRVTVKKGDKLLTYHKSVSGTFGYTVLSTVIAPKPIKDLSMKAYDGVKLEEDTYYADVDGEVMWTESSISVKNVLVIEGNAKYGIDSDTEFPGDIHVKGDVLAGVSIKSEGSIVIDGNVEACHITAAKDIIVSGGIEGDNNSLIEAGGMVVCAFAENAEIRANIIQADYVMTSKLFAEDKVIISGKHGLVVGGVTTAINEVNVDNIGSGAATVLEIDNKKLRSAELSKVIINKKSGENARVVINGRNYRGAPMPMTEYHLRDGEVVTCEIGKYVALRNYEDEPEEEQKKILIVDDEPLILKSFYNFLSEKYSVMIAASANDAGAILDKSDTPPDLILLDYNMPGMNGAEFLESIRKMTWKPYSHTPVFFVTSANDKATIIKCLSLYPQGYLSKPLSKDDLTHAIEKFFAGGEE